MFVVGACREELSEPVDRLAPILERERAQALSAERIGPAGGTLSVLSGELEGLSLEVPPGALRGDAVFSVYLAEVPPEDSGYRALGSFAKVTATVDKLLADAVLTIPYTDESEPDSSRIVLLARAGETLPVGGAVVKGLSMRGLIRTFGDFGVAADLTTDPDGGPDVKPSRCERDLTAISMKSAITISRFNATSEVGSDAAVLSLRSYGADGCGYSKGWEVVWYSDESGKAHRYSSWLTGPVNEGITTFPACSPAPVSPAVDSPALTDDFAVRWGVTPLELNVNALNCNTSPAAAPPRIRLTVGGSGSWAEYGLDGAYLGKNF
jgi:hypothetical protein